MSCDSDQPRKRPKLPRWFLITAGVLCVAVAIIGIFLPLIPTTPLLLLAAACFVRSSDRLYRWLINHRIFGKIVRDYYEHRVVSRRSKVLALTMLWLTIGSTAVFAIDAFWLRLLLLTIAIGVTIHITRLPSECPEPAPGEAEGVPRRPLVQSD
jgi:uncharacterized protein